MVRFVGRMKDLLGEVVGEPDDDAPRLVLADAVGGERGELIVIQCDLARGNLAPDAIAARKRRQRELLANHGAEWSGLARFASRYTFRRGFVEAAEVDVRTLLAHADAVFHAAPTLNALTVTGLSGFVNERVSPSPEPDAITLLHRLFTDPHYPRLRGLDIANAGVVVIREVRPFGFDGRGDAAIELMLHKGGFAQLHAFGIRDSGLSSRGVDALIQTNALAAIERLWIRDQCGTEAAFALLGHTPRLTALDVAQVDNVRVLPRIPVSIVELRVTGITDETLQVLVDRAPQLERLALDGTLHESASAFAQFPKLRALDLRDVRFGATPSSTSRVFESFVAQRLPELRELSCPSPISRNEIRAIVAAFGLQLDLLDARGEWEIEGIADDLQAQMPGELRVGPSYRESMQPLLIAGGTSREPWWDQAIVNSRLPS